MFGKTTTTAIFGLAAASGAMAGGYPARPLNNTTNVYGATGHTAPAYYTYFNTTITTTAVVPTLTTVCPYDTTLTYNNVKYTATKGQTITVTNCPCTVAKVIPTITSSLCPPGVTPTGNVVPAPAPPAPAPSPACYGVGCPAPSYPGVPVPPGSAPMVPVPVPNSPAGYPAVSPATIPAGPAATYPADTPANTPVAPPTPLASASVTYTHPAPSNIQVAGAPASRGSGLVVALFAAFMGVLAL
ncbi:hypothetical protein AAE478_002039 [Parahypoxylon ruwenzoriense]